MLKRIASIIMILCLAGLALAGCGGSENGNQAYDFTGKNCMQMTAATLYLGTLKEKDRELKLLLQHLLFYHSIPNVAFDELKYGTYVSW